MRSFLSTTACAAFIAAFCIGPISVPNTAFAQVLNPTGRAVALSVPLRERGRILGEVVMHLSATDAIAIDADTLTTLLDPLLTEAATARLLSAADSDGRIGPDTLADEGFTLEYDPAELALAITAPGSARERESLFASRQSRERPEIGIEPTDISFYTNIRAGLDVDDFEIDDNTVNNLTLRFDSVLAVPQLDHAALEATSSLNGDGEFDFGSARIVYDQPERDRRWRFGQVTSPTLGVEGGENAFALQVASEQVRLRRQDTAIETGPTTFTLERESEVRILVNGVVTRSFLLQPGNFDIRDFPVNEGLNRITVEVEDDLGRRELLTFDTFNDRRLRPVGEDAFALTVGVLEETGNDDFQFDGAFVAGFYERGVTERVTAGAYAKLSPDAQVGGAVATISALNSLFDFEVAASNSDDDFGAYGAIGVSSVWFPDGDPLDARSLTATARVQSRDFTTSLQGLGSTGNNKFDLSLGYSQNLGPWRFSVGANAELDAFDGSEDTYNARIGMGRNFGAFSFSADLGYEFGDEDDVTGFLRLSYRIDPLSDIDARYDLRQDELRSTYRRRSERNGVGAWNASVTAAYSIEDEQPDLGGSFSYQGNRGVVRLAHDLDLETLDGDEIGQRTSLDLETSIAIADGKIGVGRRINDSFALLYGHSSLSGEPVYVNPSEDEYLARSGLLGAAVVDVRDYRDNLVDYDVREAPLGYDLGTGVFNVNPTYRSGYALRVGSAFSVTALGELTDADGEPAALLIGTARSLDDEDAPVVSVFTNRRGRFAMQGIGPGRWRIEFEGGDAPQFTIDIPEDATGLVRLGVIQAE